VSSSERPTVRVPADPAAERLAAIAAEVLALAAGHGDRPLASKAAGEVVYALRSLALSLDLPSAEAFARHSLAPVATPPAANARRLPEPL
jgi:hypothetical protein